MGLKHPVQGVDERHDDVPTRFWIAAWIAAKPLVHWQEWWAQALSPNFREAVRSRLWLALPIMGLVLGGASLAAGRADLWTMSRLLGGAAMLMVVLAAALGRGYSPAVLSHSMLGVLTLVFAFCPNWDGANYSLSLYLVPILPVLGLFLLGRSGGLLYGAGALAVTLGVAYYFGVEARPAPFSEHPAIWLAIRLAALSILTCFGVLTSALSARNFRRIEKSRQALNTQLERVRQAQQSKRDFLATMSHEIRTPMNGVLGMTQILDESTPPPYSSEARRMHERATSLLGLLNRILELAKIESSQFSGQPLAFDLRALVSEQVNALRASAAGKGIVLTEAMEEAQVEVDRAHVGRALANILENAIEHSDATHVEVRLQASTERDDAFEVQVRDNGQGLSPDLRDQVRHVLSRGHHLIEGRGQGSGLGIVIAQRLLASMGGALVLRDEASGTSLVLRIPHKARAQQRVDRAPIDGEALEARARQRKLRTYLRIGIGILLFYLLQAYPADRFLNVCVGASVLFLELVACILNRRVERAKTASWVFLVALSWDFVGSSFCDGQAFSAALWLMPTVPMIAATLLGVRASWITGITSALGILGVVWMAQHWVFIPEYSGEAMQLAVFRVILVIIYASIALVADKISRDSASTLKRELGALASANIEAEQANQETARFLEVMSKKIERPMREILEAAGRLRASPELPASHSMLDTISRSGRHLLVLMRETMEISCVPSCVIETQELEFCLLELVGDVERLFGPKARLSGLRLRVEAPEDPIRVRGDATKMLQILCNLVGNAIKFSDQGEVVLRLGAEQKADQHGVAGYQVAISVKDQGIGIDKTQQSQIFEDFVQLDASLSKNAKGGTGLGLGICAKLAHLMGGDISLESEQGKGSCFELSLWLASSRAKSQIGATCGAAGAFTVLVVDDNAINRKVARAHIESLGAQVILAASGQEALLIAEKQPIHVALVDLRMPGMDGFETIGRLQAGEGALGCIVAFSAEYEGEDLQRLAKLGITQRLDKPLVRDALCEILETQGLQATGSQPAAA